MSHFFAQLHTNPSLTQSDYVYPWIAALAWAVVHFIVQKLILDPVAKQYALSKTDAVKFHVSGWKLFSFISTTLFGLFVVGVEHWTFTPKLYMQGWPNHPFSLIEQSYYVFCFGNVAYSSLNMLIEPKQKDFLAMIIHHLTTLFLIVFSYMFGFQRIGCIVLLVHDISDPIMEAAKCSLYLGKKILANFFFVVFMISFLFTRWFIYPYYVIGSFLWYGFHENGQRFPNGDHAVFHTLMISMYILQVLHIYWGYLILQLAYKVVTEKELKGDIRDKDDNEKKED